MLEIKSVRVKPRTYISRLSKRHSRLSPALNAALAGQGASPAISTATHRPDGTRHACPADH
jgi:hypothetical protein